MGVGGMPAHGDHRRGLGFQAAGAELFQDPGLHLPLGKRPARAQLGAEALPDPGHDRIQVHRGGLMAAGALFVQDPQEALDQGLGGAQGEAAFLQQLGGAVVQVGEHGQLAGVLAGHRPQPAGQLPQARQELLPGGVGEPGPGQGVQDALLDGVHQLAGLPLGGHQVHPGARVVHRVGDSQNAIGDAVAVLEVIE